MQNKKFQQITIMVPVPLEAVEVSGILDEPALKVLAKKGKLLITTVPDDDDDEYENERTR